MTMTDSTAAERVAAAAARLGEDNAAMEAHYREQRAAQNTESAARDARAARMRQAIEQREQDARQALMVTDDALRQLDRYADQGRREIDEFKRDNRVERSMVLERVERSLAAVERAREEAVSAAVARIVSPHASVSPDGLANLRTLDALCDPAAQDRLRDLIDRSGLFTSLSAEEIAERVAAARELRQEIDELVRTARGLSREVAAALQEIAAGRDADPMEPAAQVIALREDAASRFTALRLALAGQATTTETTR